jgi:hypothetical protein
MPIAETYGTSVFANLTEILGLRNASAVFAVASSGFRTMVEGVKILSIQATGPEIDSLMSEQLKSSIHNFPRENGSDEFTKGKNENCSHSEPSND